MKKILFLVVVPPPMDCYPPDGHPVGAASSFIGSRNDKRKGGIKMTRWEYV